MNFVGTLFEEKTYPVYKENFDKCNTKNQEGLEREY
jgi:hypothetical protein